MKYKKHFFAVCNALMTALTAFPISQILSEFGRMMNPKHEDSSF